jgi:hypothetical protein
MHYYNLISICSHLLRRSSLLWSSLVHSSSLVQLYSFHTCPLACHMHDMGVLWPPSSFLYNNMVSTYKLGPYLFRTMPIIWQHLLVFLLYKHRIFCHRLWNTQHYLWFVSSCSSQVEKIYVIGPFIIFFVSLPGRNYDVSLYIWGSFLRYSLCLFL